MGLGFTFEAFLYEMLSPFVLPVFSHILEDAQVGDRLNTHSNGLD